MDIPEVQSNTEEYAGACLAKAGTGFAARAAGK
jgi:hypothetical protein